MGLVCYPRDLGMGLVCLAQRSGNGTSVFSPEIWEWTIGYTPDLGMGLVCKPLSSLPPSSPDRTPGSSAKRLPPPLTGEVVESPLPSLQASPIRPRRFTLGPARGMMKGKDSDKPVLLLQWLVGGKRG